METHEHLIPDDELPGADVFAPEFIRERLAESEQAGVLVWDDDNSTYRTSARGLMLGIGMGCIERAREIDPYADQDEIMRHVTECLPWEAKALLVNELVEIDPDAPDFAVPDNFPEEWER